MIPRSSYYKWKNHKEALELEKKRVKTQLSELSVENEEMQRKQEVSRAKRPKRREKGSG